jgi:Pentapeptide repeats (8 copies)
MNLPPKNFLRDNSVLLSCTGFALLVVGIPVWMIQQRNVNILDGKIQEINLELSSARADKLEILKLKKDILVIDKDKTIILNGIGATIAQALGAVVLGATAYVGYQNFKVGVDNLKINEESLRVAREQQVTERFSKGIEHLGSGTIDIRLGGIYALEQIANDSPEKYHWTIMEILSAFVREKCPISVNKAEATNESSDTTIEKMQAAITTTMQKVRAEKAAANDNTIEKRLADIQAAFDTTTEKDIQAALTVMGQRKSEQDPEDKIINLRKVNISGVELQKANFSKANLICANLVGADLSEIDFSESFLVGADLSEAYLVGAKLRGANLIGAKLHGADLSEADLTGANLSEADLRQCKNLTREQIDSATTDGNTEWPYHLRPREI